MRKAVRHGKGKRKECANHCRHWITKVCVMPNCKETGQEWERQVILLSTFSSVPFVVEGAVIFLSNTLRQGRKKWGVGDLPFAFPPGPMAGACGKSRHEWQHVSRGSQCRAAPRLQRHPVPLWPGGSHVPAPCTVRPVTCQDALRCWTPCGPVLQCTASALGLSCVKVWT